MHLVGIERTDLEQFFHLGDRDLAAGGDHRIEVARRLPIDEIARFVALPSLDYRHITSARIDSSSTYALSSKILVSFSSANLLPNAVRVKKPGIPAPPARSFSASVPCGVSDSSSSPARTCRSNSLFSPTYEAITLFTWRVLSSKPIPKSSTPALLPTIVRPLTPLATTAPIRFSGMPHSPKPPAAIVMSSRKRSASAALGSAYTFFIDF